MAKTNKKYTQEEFEKMCRDIHGDKYDYSYDTYKGMNTLYKVLCKKHGFFYIKPSGIIHQGQGCKKCYLESTVERNKTKYKDQLKIKHEGKYTIVGWGEFSERRNKVQAYCKDHGEYTSSVASLLDTTYGGCPRCKQLKEAAIFINKAKTIHGERYFYCKEDYVCSRTLMRIWCNTHEKFFYQRPSAHLQGQGCPECGQEDRQKTMAKSHEDFINQAKEVHNSFYDYSETHYSGAHNKIKIICPVHGGFEMTAQAHLSGYGCVGCSRDRMEAKNKNSFIENSKNMYGDCTYDYSKVVYVNNRTKVCLKCNMHNEWFWVSPNKHLNKGRSGGCPVCSKLTMNRWSFKSVKRIPNIEKEKGYFYLGAITSLLGTKMGVTKDLTHRLDIYRRDLGKYEDRSFNYTKVLHTSYLKAFLIEEAFKTLLKPYYHKHNLMFGGKNEVYNIPTPLYNLINEVVQGRFDLEFEYLSKCIDDTKDIQFINFIKKLKEVINE